MSRLTLCSVLLLATTLAACSGTTTTPTPDPDPITDVYSGTLTKNGADRHTFVTARSGLTTVTLIALTPAEAVVQLALGTFNTTLNVCQLVITNDKATLNTILVGQSDQAGNLCVRIADDGAVTDPVDYQIQVVHN